jgi:tetratricopeptide (TPR) repeat protein
MKPLFVALSVAFVATVVTTAVMERDRLQDGLQTLLGKAEVGEQPQLMGVGSLKERLSAPSSATALDTRQSDIAPDGANGSAASANSRPTEIPPSDPFAAAPDAQSGNNNEIAQATPPSTAPPPAAGGQPQPDVDESALRYFASHGDKGRLQAEIARLKALYPNWTPPADPLAVPQNQDKRIEALWQLYSEGRYAELRKAIAERQAAESDWQPPADLIDRLNIAETRARLVNASDLKQYGTVIELGSQTPSLLTCSDVDILWRVAEAFALTDRLQRARDAYLYILKNCENPPERLATIQKASALLPYAMMQDLLSEERPLPGGTREFESIRDDLARRFLAAATDNPNLTISPDYLNRVERAGETQGLASDALLLGWYLLRHEDMTDAEKWFRASRAKDDTASASQGLALTLIARKAPQEAEDVMFRWRDASKDATATYLAATANVLAIDPPVILPTEVLQRIAAEVLKTQDPATAQQFGWYARALNQHEAARQWFETALRWKPDDEPSAYGLALTRNQLNDKRGVAEIQRLWAGRSERIARLGEVEPKQNLGRTPLPPPGPAPTGRGFPETSAGTTFAPAAVAPALPSAPRQLQSQTVPRARAYYGCAKTIDPVTLSPGAALQRGWCLMDLNRPIEAAAAFEIALRSDNAKTRQDGAYGQSLAYMRLGLTSQAAVAATKAPQNPQRALELQTTILSARAINAFGAKRYRESILFLDQLALLQPERTDLMVMRGYAYLRLKHFSEAIRVFEAAAATGNQAAITGLSDARDEQKAPPR